MLFSFYDAIDWGNARLNDATNFLRSIPSFFAPKPSQSSIPFVPPFTGGQSQGVLYNYVWSPSVTLSNGATQSATVDGQILGKVGVRIDKILDGSGVTFGGGIYLTQNNIGVRGAFERSNGVVSWQYALTVTRADGQPDTGGSQPNPNPSLPIADDGLFTPNNPVIGDENGTVNPAAIVLSPAAPLILIGGGLAAATAAAAAAQAASDALQAIKKVAESLDSLKKIWEKLQEFLEEWEKDRPKNRDIVRQTYGSIDGDGAIDFYPLKNKNFTAIQVDIVVTEIPLGFGKYFGSMSPSRYRYKELGYISFYSINKGIIETHSIQFKRSSLAVPKTAVGFIYHFGLDNKIKGFAFGTFSVRKS